MPKDLGNDFRMTRVGFQIRKSQQFLLAGAPSPHPRKEFLAGRQIPGTGIIEFH